MNKTVNIFNCRKLATILNKFWVTEKNEDEAFQFCFFYFVISNIVIVVNLGPPMF